MLLKELNLIIEAKSYESKTVYLRVDGEYYIDSKNMHLSGTYAIDVPNEKLTKFMSSYNKKAEKENSKDIQDWNEKLEQDPWGQRGYAKASESRMTFHDATTTKPAGRILKNYYSMVYLLRDEGLLDAEYAKSIASTKE